MITNSFGAAVALLLSFMIYLFASKKIRLDRLPLNASAQEIEEPGRNITIIEFASAHLRYKVAGRPDPRLGNPGDNPYRLPDLDYTVDWHILAADLVVHMQPLLHRDTYQLSPDRRIFSLHSSGIYAERRRTTWIVYTCTPSESHETILLSLDRYEHDFDDHQLVYAICVDDNTRYKTELITPKGKKVELYSKAFLVETGLNLHLYAESLLRRFEEKNVPGADYTLRDCFVVPRVREIKGNIGDLFTLNQGDDLDHSLLDVLDDWSNRAGVDHLSIVGEFGQGKSTALLAFCARWARSWIEGDRRTRIPLLIELRGKSPRRQSPDRFLAEWGDRFGLRGDALFSLVQSGRALLIFEGFDEVQDAGLRYDRFEQFKALWSFSYPGTKIIFTGRPNFFLDTNERARLLKNNSSARDAGLLNSRLYSMKFLDEDSIFQALKMYPSVIISEIVEQCRKDPAFLEIAKRPSMLPVLGNQWMNIRSQITEHEGITSAAIIKHFIEFLYARKEADNESLGDYQLLHRSVRHFLTQRIVWQMISSQSRNTIDYNQFVLAVEDGLNLLDTQFRGYEDDDKEIATSIAGLKERFLGRPRAEFVAAVATDVRTNGLFVPDPAGGRDNLYFPHKQYYEFLFGEVLLSSFFDSKSNHWAASLPINEVIDGVNSEPIALFFASGLLNVDSLVKSNRGSRLAIFLNRSASVAVALRTDLRRTISRLTKQKRPMMPIIRQACPLKYKYLGLNGDIRIALLSLLIATTSFFALLITLTSRLGIGVFKLRPSDLNTVFISGFLGAINVLFVSLVVRKPGLRLEGCLLLMELYRRDRIQKVLQDHGVKAHSALIMLLFLKMPNGSVQLPRRLFEEAVQNLELNEEVFMSAKLFGERSGEIS